MYMWNQKRAPDLIPSATDNKKKILSVGIEMSRELNDNYNTTVQTTYTGNSR